MALLLFIKKSHNRLYTLLGFRKNLGQAGSNFLQLKDAAQRN